jgi:hypothetical protein
MKDINFKRVYLGTLLIMASLSVCLTAEKFYWQYWPFVPSIVHSIKVTNPGKVVCPGENMTYEVDIDRKIPGPVTVKRQLVNSQVISLPEAKLPAKPLGRQLVSAYAPTPRSADYGTWYMRWTAEYPIGPNGRIVQVSKDSEEYRVVFCQE